MGSLCFASKNSFWSLSRRQTGSQQETDSSLLSSGSTRPKPHWLSGWQPVELLRDSGRVRRQRRVFTRRPHSAWWAMPYQKPGLSDSCHVHRRRDMGETELAASEEIFPNRSIATSSELPSEGWSQETVTQSFPFPLCGLASERRTFLHCSLPPSHDRLLLQSSVTNQPLTETLDRSQSFLLLTGSGILTQWQEASRPSRL